MTVDEKHKVIHNILVTDLIPLGVYTITLKVDLETDMNGTLSNSDFAFKVTIEHPCETTRLITSPILNMDIREGQVIPKI
jgi:hypothetical protein